MRILESPAQNGASSHPQFEQWRQNQILANLPEKELMAVGKHLQPLDLKFKQVLLNSDEEIEFLYFPTTGVISLISQLENGEGLEVGLVGAEQFTPHCSLYDEKFSPYINIVQVPGRGFRLPIKQLAVLLREYPAFEKILHRGVFNLSMMISQTAVCGHMHEAEERLARWILMMNDRSPIQPMPLTHDLLSQMLGSRRATVSIAAAHLQNKKLIEYSRGKLTLLDRIGLEAEACECYKKGRKYS